MQITLQLKVKRAPTGSEKRCQAQKPSRLSGLRKAVSSVENRFASKLSRADTCPQEELLQASLDKLTELTHHFGQVQELLRRTDKHERILELLRDELDQHLDDDLFSDEHLFTDDDRVAASTSPLAGGLAVCVPGPEGEEC